MRTSPVRVGRILTVTTITLAAAASLGACGVLGGDDPADPKRDDVSGEVTESADADVFAIKVGDCLDLSSVTAEQVDSLPVVPCSDSHDSEVYAETTLTGDDFPGEDSVTASMDEFCATEFASFIGITYDQSSLSFNYLFPTEESWGAGDKSGQCIVIDPAGARTGTLKGAGV